MAIAKESSEAPETAESDKAAELSGSETVLQESPEGELLPRIQQINEQIKRKIKRLHNSAKDKIKNKTAPLKPLQNSTLESCKDGVGNDNVLESDSTHKNVITRIQK